MRRVLQHNNKPNPDLPRKLSLALRTGRDMIGWTIWLLIYADCQSFHIFSNTMGRDHLLQIEAIFKINIDTNSQ
jgi:hypothetical protein